MSGDVNGPPSSSQILELLGRGEEQTSFERCVQAGKATKGSVVVVLPLKLKFWSIAGHTVDQRIGKEYFNCKLPLQSSSPSSAYSNLLRPFVSSIVSF